jgi:hypothetical protein
MVIRRFKGRVSLKLTQGVILYRGATVDGGRSSGVEPGGTVDGLLGLAAATASAVPAAAVSCHLHSTAGQPLACTPGERSQKLAGNRLTRVNGSLSRSINRVCQLQRTLPQVLASPKESHNNRNIGMSYIGTPAVSVTLTKESLRNCRSCFKRISEIQQDQQLHASGRWLQTSEHRFRQIQAVCWLCVDAFTIVLTL